MSINQKETRGLNGNKRFILIILMGGLRMVLCMGKTGVKGSHGEIFSKLKCDIILSNY